MHNPLMQTNLEAKRMAFGTHMFSKTMCVPFLVRYPIQMHIIRLKLIVKRSVVPLD